MTARIISNSNQEKTPTVDENLLFIDFSKLNIKISIKTKYNIQIFTNLVENIGFDPIYKTIAGNKTLLKELIKSENSKIKEKFK